MKNNFKRLYLILIGMLLSSPSAWSSDGCVDVTLGPVPLSVPQQHMTPTTPRKSSTGNFIFAFDSTIPGIDCQIGCKDLFVTVSYAVAGTPEQQWIYKEPKYTGQSSGKYRVYLSRFDQGSFKPLQEILVPSEVVRPQDEFYGCVPEGR